MRSHLTLFAGGLALVTALVWLRGCPSPLPPVHLNPNMDDQPRYDAQEASGFFYDGAASRLPVPGTVARGELVEDDVFASGRSVWSGWASQVPFELAPGDLERGRERYHIYCTPCHGERGDGDGMLERRTGIATANLLEDRIRSQPAGRLFRTVGDGTGLMSGYRALIPARDRWLIVAHLRTLQEAD